MPNNNDATPQGDNTEATGTVLDSGTGVTEDYQVPEKFLNEAGEVDMNKFGQSYHAMESKMGSKMTPDAAGDYSYEGAEYDEEFTTDLQNRAFEMGLSPEQYSGMMDIVGENIGLGADSEDNAREVLTELWGDNLPAEVQKAQDVWNLVVGQDEDFDINEVGNNPSVIRFLNKLHAEFAEDGNIPSAAQPSMATKGEIADLMNHPGYTDPMNAEHAEINRRVDDFFNHGGTM